MSVTGTCAPGYERVRARFEENFRRHGEVGAAVAAFVDGAPVVNLWGGVARRKEGLPWAEDTLVCMMSVNKAMSALCVHLLVQEGEVELDAPMARYWPEFAGAGKERITVAQMLAHRSGVLWFSKLERGQLFNHERAARALEQEPPEWADASRGCYHTSTYGVMIRELVQRVTGEPLPAFFHRRVNERLGTEYHFVTRSEDLGRVAHVIEPPLRLLGDMLFNEPYCYRSLKAWIKIPPLGPLQFNSPTYLQAGFASGSGVGTARSVARIASELACASGQTLLRPETLKRAAEPSWEERCWMSGIPTRMALGFTLNAQGGAYYGPNPRSFGHAGRGGSFFFADPDRRVGFCYCTNRLTRSGVPDERSQRLVAALYEALGASGRGAAA